MTTLDDCFLKLTNQLFLSLSFRINFHTNLYFSCYMLDELMEPLRVHLAPRLGDALLLGIVGGASKRLEMSIKRVSKRTILCYPKTLMFIILVFFLAATLRAYIGNCAI